MKGGDIVGVQGPSGCGKSTLLRVLASVQKPTAGALLYHEVPVRAPVRTGYVMTVDQYTTTALDRRWPIWKTLTEPLLAAGRRPHPSPSQRRRIAAEQLATIGLGLLDIEARPRELSGGQRQRVNILRALLAEPSLLVADEPTAALDVSVAAGVLRLLSDAADRGLAIVVASHNLPSLQVLCDRVLELHPEGLRELPGERPSRGRA